MNDPCPRVENLETRFKVETRVNLRVRKEKEDSCIKEQRVDTKLKECPNMAAVRGTKFWPLCAVTSTWIR